MTNNYSLTITSNYLNHYSLALCKEMKKVFKDFHFVVCEKLPEERKSLGFDDFNNLDFVVREWDDPKKVEELFLNSDFVITDYYYHKYLKKRLKLNKPVIYDSERLFKDNNEVFKILRYIKYWCLYHNDKKSPLLCISAYTANDYNSIGLFKNRTYKWAYFSSAIEYDNFDELLENKKGNSLVWAGRLIKWKHPEYAVEVAKKLKELKYDFTLNIIGNGEMENELKVLIKKYDLNDNVHLLGSMSPDKVRKYMEESQIYLFTSDRGEGWGVVLNEAMNSGCACVASYETGSTPFLVIDKENGLTYKDNDINELFNKTKYLLDNKNELNKIANNAYKTIINEWNPKIAAERFSLFVDSIYNNKNTDNLYDKNVLSKALPIR